MLEIVLIIIIYFVLKHVTLKKLSAIEKRLAKLENIGVQISQEKQVQPPVQSVSVVESVPLYTQNISPSPEPTPTPAPVLEPTTTHTEDFGSVLAKVGIAILVLGVAFFLNYINSRGLISVNLKFVLGLIAGGVMIGTAEYLREKSRHYAQILTGGGFIVWFLSIFVGSMIYGIFGMTTALMLTTGVVILSFLVSVREKSETTFIIGTLGAYLVPLLAGNYSDGAMSTVYVLWYISIINIGIILISRSMDWIRSITIGFIFSWLILFSVYRDMEQLGWVVQWLFITIIGLTYLIAFTIRDIRESKELENVQASIVLTVLNTAIYSIAAYDTLYTTILSPYLGFLITLLAIIHFVVYAVIRNTTERSDHPSALTHLVLAITMITAAVPVQFDGPIVTMIWFIEGVVISYLATLRDFKGKFVMYMLGLVSIVAGIVHMNMFGDYVGVRESGTFMFNQKYAVWLFVIILMHGIAYIWKASVQEEGIVEEFKKNILISATFLVLLGQLFFVGLTVSEIGEYKSLKIDRVYAEQNAAQVQYENYYGDNLYETAEQQKEVEDMNSEARQKVEGLNREFSFMNIIFFIIMTVIYLVIGLLKSSVMVRRLGVVSLVVTVLQLFALTWSLGPIYRIASFVSLGIILLIIAYAYIVFNKNKNNTAGTITTAVLILVASFFSSHVQAAVIDPAAWTHTTTFSAQDVVLHDGAWYMAQVDASVWSKSAVPNQADIRIINAQQEEIPYVIVKQGATAKVQNPTQNTNSLAKILENTLQSKAGSSERIIVIDTGKEGQVYTGMTFERSPASQNFRKAVKVYISDTLIGASSPAWREVEQKNVIYNYVDPVGFSVEDMDIHFPNMTSRYIKVKFEDDIELRERGVSFGNQIQISGVRVTYDQLDTTTGTQIKNYISGNFDFADMTKGKSTDGISKKVLRIDENTGMKSTEIYLTDMHAITGLTLHVDAKNTNFNRDVTVQGSMDATNWQTVATGQIYRIDSPIYSGESLHIVTPVITYPHLRIIVQNKNDTALQFENTVDATVQRIGILFKAEGVDVQTLKFLIGNKDALAPTYEIEKTLAYFNTSIPSHVSLFTISENKAYVPEVVYVPFGEKFAYIINSVLVVFVLVLGYLGYTWTKKA